MVGALVYVHHPPNNALCIRGIRDSSGLVGTRSPKVPIGPGDAFVLWTALLPVVRPDGLLAHGSSETCDHVARGGGRWVGIGSLREGWAGRVDSASRSSYGLGGMTPARARWRPPGVSSKDSAQVLGSPILKTPRSSPWPQKLPFRYRSGFQVDERVETLGHYHWPAWAVKQSMSWSIRS